MPHRINAMRLLFREKLEAYGERVGSWRHITDQIGMFCYTGLTVQQVRVAYNSYADTECTT